LTGQLTYSSGWFESQFESQFEFQFGPQFETQWGPSNAGHHTHTYSIINYVYDFLLKKEYENT